MRTFKLFLLFTSLLATSHAWSSSSNFRRTSTALSASTPPSNNNIVLRPSTDPEAFDSFRIGSARVHRYIRDSGTPEDEAEYVMWYHGRSETFDADKSLPPLSTGRIGRATSRNGLHWERTLEGSLSEDVPGVSLGLNKDSWWGFDTAHVGLGQVLLPMSTPAVMAEGGVYLMYYMGGNNEETPIADYLENVPESSANAKIKGMNLKIGVAISQDGCSWGRVEGDDPSGACMAGYNKADPNMKFIATMRDDDDSLLKIDEELYCGWPEVVVCEIDEEEQAASVQKKSPFLMYYSTMTKKDKKKCIACAVSNDGFRWFKRGVCIRPDESGLDAAGCARCNVIRKANFDEATGVWSDDEGFIMYYEGVSEEDGKHRIMMAESQDGRVWEKQGVVFDVGDIAEAWDTMGVGSPHVLRMDDGTQRMYYTGQGADGSTAIGVASLKPGDSHSAWTREQAEFSFA